MSNAEECGGIQKNTEVTPVRLVVFEKAGVPRQFTIDRTVKIGYGRPEGVRDGVLYLDYSFMDEPEPSPTPEPTPSPEPTPVPTASPEPTPEPVQSSEPEPEPIEEPIPGVEETPELPEAGTEPSV